MEHHAALYSASEICWLKRNIKENTVLGNLNSMVPVYHKTGHANMDFIGPMWNIVLEIAHIIGIAKVSTKVATVSSVKNNLSIIHWIAATISYLTLYLKPNSRVRRKINVYLVITVVIVIVVIVVVVIITGIYFLKR